MTTRRLRIVCPGATAAGVVSTLLIADRAAFSVEPQADGRFVVEAQVSGVTAAKVEAQGKAPIIVEGDGPLPAPAPAAVPATVVEPIPPALLHNPDLGELVDKSEFSGCPVAQAKTKATQVAAKFGAVPFGSSSWRMWETRTGGKIYLRAAYRGKKSGEIALAADTKGGWVVGWIPRTI